MRKAKPNILAKFLTAAAVLSTIQPSSSLIINPINDPGILFDHAGSYMIKRGIWTTNINTNISPTEDIATINNIHNNITNTLERMRQTVHDDSLLEMKTSVKQHTMAALQEILAVRRNKRSKGIFGFLKDVLFGGDNIEEEIDTIKTRQQFQLHEVSDKIATIYSKNRQLNEHINKKIQHIEGKLQKLNSKYTTQAAEEAIRRLTESVILTNQFMETTVNKYKAVRSHPFTQTEIDKIMNEINHRLPNGYEILNNPTATYFSWEENNGHMHIIMEAIIISSEIYELFKIIPVPSPVNRTIIITPHTYIAMSHAQRFFYPTAQGEQFNKSHYITDQHTISTEPDCIAAALLKNPTKKSCRLQQLPFDYLEIIPLTTTNQFMYYTHNPNSVRIHCDKTIAPSYYAAVIKLSINCEIRTRKGITNAYIYEENNKTNMYLRTVDNIPHTMWEAITSPHPEYSHPMTTDPPVINQNFKHHSLTILAIATTVLTISAVIVACYFIGRDTEHNPNNPSDTTLEMTPRRSERRPPPRRAPRMITINNADNLV